MGKVLFKGSVLEVPDSVYAPREDSELLAKTVEKERVSENRFLDMGCGSGAQGITALKKEASHVVFADINPEAVRCATENAKREGFENIEGVQSDLFENVKGKFDVITLNPPYVKLEEGEVPDARLTGGKSGREVTERFLEKAGAHLERKGFALLLCSSQNDFAEVEARMKKEEWAFSVAASKRLFFEELRVYRLGFK